MPLEIQRLQDVADKLDAFNFSDWQTSTNQAISQARDLKDALRNAKSVASGKIQKYNGFGCIGGGVMALFGVSAVIGTVSLPGGPLLFIVGGSVISFGFSGNQMYADCKVYSKESELRNVMDNQKSKTRELINLLQEWDNVTNIIYENATLSQYMNTLVINGINGGLNSLVMLWVAKIKIINEIRLINEVKNVANGGINGLKLLVSTLKETKILRSFGFNIRLSPPGGVNLIMMSTMAIRLSAISAGISIASGLFDVFCSLKNETDIDQAIAVWNKEIKNMENVTSELTQIYQSIMFNVTQS
eukprot:155152_1